MHKNPIQVASLHTPDLDSLVPPPHDLPRTDVGNAGW